MIDARIVRQVGFGLAGMLCILASVHCGDDGGSGDGDGSGAGGAGAGSSSSSGTGAGSSSSSGTGAGSAACSWDVPSDLHGQLYRLEAGDMGLSVGYGPDSTLYRIPCDGGPLEQLDVEGYYGSPVRQMPDGGLYTGEAFLQPDLTVDPLPPCSGGCSSGYYFRVPDDEGNLYGHEGDGCTRETDATTGELVAENCEADNPFPMAALPNGMVAALWTGAEVGIFCYPDGLASTPTLVATADALGASAFIAVDSIYLAPRDGAFFMAHGYNGTANTTGIGKFWLRSLTCGGDERWTIEANYAGSGIALHPAQSGGTQQALWTDDGDVLLALHLGSAPWQLGSAQGGNFVGLFDGATGAPRWVKGWGSSWELAPNIAVGPNGTIWVSTLTTGVSVLDAAGDVLLGQPLPKD